jgi:hypothetical protein
MYMYVYIDRYDGVMYINIMLMVMMILLVCNNILLKIRIKPQLYLL